MVMTKVVAMGGKMKMSDILSYVYFRNVLRELIESENEYIGHLEALLNVSTLHFFHKQPHFRVEPRVATK